MALNAEIETGTRQPIDDWMDFCRNHGNPCFAGWPDSILRAWLNWHCGQRGLIVIHDDAGTILALGIAWQCRRAHLETHWQAGDPAGDCLYISHFVARTPRALQALVREMSVNWPHWQQLNLFARRRARGVIPLNQQTVIKLYRLVQRRLLKEDLCAKTLN